jgi:serine/threonine-protein kinase
VLSPELAAVLGVERFLAEIQVTASLQHPNLLPLFDSGEADGLLFYVMPFIDGESLRHRIDREKQLPVEDAVRLATAVAGALDYAHRHGVIHRDLKPENILLHEGQPLVADFGIALAVVNAGGNRITATGLSLGTPQYMSPEQATGDRAIDGRTDIYSLGAVLYEMLTGDPPHFGSTSQAIIARLLTEKPRSVRALRDSVPVHVDAAIERALAKLPADRWSTAHEFADALNHQGPVSTTSREIRNAPPAPRIPVSGAARTRSIAAGLLVMLAIAGAAFAGVWIGAHRVGDGLTVRYPLNFESDESAAGAQGSTLALSPDGKLLAYLGLKGGRRRLRVRALADMRARELPGTDDALQPFFSPDGKWIGFVSRSQLKKVPVDGGAAVFLADVVGFRGASWYRDDQIVVSTNDRLATVPAIGGAPHPFTAIDSAAGESSQRFPFVLSDGKTVLYASFGRGGAAGMRIAVASLQGTATRVLDLVGTAPVATIEGQLIYASAAGAILAVPFDERRQRVTGTPVPVINDVLVGGAGPLKGTVSRSGSLAYVSGSATQQVVLADAHGEARTLAIPAGRYDHPRLSPDGKQLALEVNTGETTDIHIFDLVSRTLARLTTDGAFNVNAEWTPDGKRVIFSSQREGRPTLWWQLADHSGPAERLAKLDNAAVAEGVLSADGGMLVVRSAGGETSNDIWYRRMANDTSMKPLVIGPFNELAPRISPNGRWVAYSSDESGAQQVYVTPLPGPGGHYPVSADGGNTPVWSPDGRRVYYTNGRTLFAATVSFSPTFSVTARDTIFRSGMSSVPVHASYDVAPDGKHFVILRSTGPDAQLIIVHDWKYELRARIARSTPR